MVFYVLGFPDAGEADRFVKAEIRYIKSSEMTVDLLEGPILRFSVPDRDDLATYLAGLEDVAGGRVRVLLQETGEVLPELADAAFVERLFEA